LCGLEENLQHLRGRRISYPRTSGPTCEPDRDSAGRRQSRRPPLRPARLKPSRRRHLSDLRTRYRCRSITILYLPYRRRTAQRWFLTHHSKAAGSGVAGCFRGSLRASSFHWETERQWFRLSHGKTPPKIALCQRLSRDAGTPHSVEKQNEDAIELGLDRPLRTPLYLLLNTHLASRSQDRDTHQR
jgi:hypothetical protein